MADLVLERELYSRTLDSTPSLVEVVPGWSPDASMLNNNSEMSCCTICVNFLQFLCTAVELQSCEPLGEVITQGLSPEEKVEWYMTPRL